MVRRWCRASVLTATRSTPVIRDADSLQKRSGIAGALLASSGLYLLYYWLPQLLGAARPSDGGVAALSA